jgi:hypothetical protein
MYSISGTIAWDTVAAGTRRLGQLYSNNVGLLAEAGHWGETITSTAGGYNGSHNINIATTAFLQAGDQVYLYGLQDSGAALNVRSQLYSPTLMDYMTEFAISLLGGPQGIAGPPGLTPAYRGTYSATTAYNPGDIVVGPDGFAYESLTAQTGVAPVAWGTVPPIPYGTSLPGTPVDGQEAILVSSITNPTYTWRFRYNAQSTSAYKWEFIGGSPYCMSANQGAWTGAFTMGTGGWSIGPSPCQFNTPRPGDYYVVHGGQMQVGAVANWVAVAVARSGANPCTATQVYQNMPGIGNQYSYAFSDKATSVGSSDWVAATYSTSDTAFQVANRYMQVTPVRVS